MIFLWIACGLMAMGFAFFGIKWLLLRREIRRMAANLNDLATMDTNVYLNTGNFDAATTSLTASINYFLDKNRRSILQTQRLENDLKRVITNISHDLRTPLTAAKGYLQMLEGGETDAETTQRYLSVIGGRLGDLTVLMDNLFAFTRAVEGTVTLSRVNVANTLRETLVAAYTEIEAKGFAVESIIPDTPVYCACDEDALKRVLQNLISNAVFHGKDTLRVTLIASSECVIEIANAVNEPIDTTFIFDRFYTADAARTQKRTGLGLAIAKELTQKMSAQIVAEQNGAMLVMRVSLLLFDKP